MTLSSLSKPSRLYEIDLLRFLAALSVVVFHYTYRGYAADQYSPLPFLELGRYTRYGYLGVELFFIISGYVVLLSAQGKTIRQFFVSRLVRLYPAFWIACTLTFLAKRLWGPTRSDAHMPTMLHAGFGQYLCNMTMLEEFIGIDPIDGAYWSLTAELTFYFLVSLLLAFRLMRYVDWILVGWLMYAVVPFFPHANTPFAALLIPTYAPFFVAGMLFFLVQQPTPNRSFRYVLLVFAYLAALQSSLREARENGHYYQDEFLEPIVAAIITTFFLLFVLIASHKLNLSRYKWLLGLGSLTYPLYLIHSDIGYIAFYRLGHLSNKYVIIGCTLGFMLGVACLIHRWGEKRFSKAFEGLLNKWLRRFDSSRG